MGSFVPRNNLIFLSCGNGAARPAMFSWKREELHRRRSAFLKPVKSVGNDGMEVTEDDEKLRATIEKSKKVLAVQKSLLLQIAERRKLISDIKDSITEFENPVVEQKENLATIRAEEVEVEVEVGDDENGRISWSEFIGSSTGEKMIEDGLSATVEHVEDEKDIQKSISSSPVDNSNENILSPDMNSFSSLSKNVVVDERMDTLDDELLTDLSQDEQHLHSPLAGNNVMNIVLVAAECAPWSKTGGLGDVVGSLPKALARRGHRVMVVVPRYGNYAEPTDTGVRRRYRVDGEDHEISYYQAYIDGVDFVFIDSQLFRHTEHNIYGGDRLTLLKRLVLFCKAAVEVPWHVPCGGVCYGDGNLAFIANDWHTALLPVYLKAYYRENGAMQYARSVLVIHNIAHQGRGPVGDFFMVDLPAHYVEQFKVHDAIGGEHFNVFAAGLKAADRLVTVSHGYAWEVKTSEGGWGLHEIINQNDWKMKGIVNGIDDQEWNPLRDVHLQSDGYTNYSLETLEKGKPQCKQALQKELGLPVLPDVPLLGFIGRLDHQKGVDLIAEAVPWLANQNVQLVMLGSGRQDLEQLLRQFEVQYADRIRGWVGFSVRTAHRITAGADILLMPSRFEPCGLNQLYAMMYGTVPVVHAVGGLRDTVQPFDPYKECGLGWTFSSADAGKFIEAIGNCLLTYREYESSWKGLQRRGMMQDLSWDRAAALYEEVLLAAKYQW